MTYSMPGAYATQQQSDNRVNVMRIPLLIAAAIGLGALAPAAGASSPREKEQDQAWRATKQGHIMPLRAIEGMIVPRMRGADYLGPELNGDRYRLKFMHEGRVLWVDVDARTGRVVGKSGF